MHDEKLHDLHSPSITTVIICRMRQVGHAAHLGNTEMHSLLMRKFKGESLLGRPKDRWEDYVRTDLKGTRCEDVEWNDVALSMDKWTALVEGAFLVPQNVGKFLTS
jgi:hypothetical protein